MSGPAESRDHGSDGALRSRLWRWLRQVLIIVAAVAFLGVWQSRKLLPSGTPAPSAGLPALADAWPKASAGSTRPVLLYYFAPWCAVCKASIANLAWVERLLPAGGIGIVPVALSYDSRGEVEQFIKENDVELPVLYGDDQIAAAYRINAFPTSYVVGPDGTVRFSTVGYTTTLGLIVRILLAR